MAEDPRQPWDRRENESARAYAAFRAFRDLGPVRRLADVVDFPHRQVQTWSRRNGWVDRALAWDDETHRLDDQRRLDAIRRMHNVHQRAARLAITRAIAALQRLDPAEIPAYAAARLLELGARLERDTLTVSVEELQGITALPLDGEDPWDRIARDFQASQ
jgi:hypothetical protein